MVLYVRGGPPTSSSRRKPGPISATSRLHRRVARLGPAFAGMMKKSILPAICRQQALRVDRPAVPLLRILMSRDGLPALPHYPGMRHARRRGAGRMVGHRRQPGLGQRYRRMARQIDGRALGEACRRDRQQQDRNANRKQHLQGRSPCTSFAPGPDDFGNGCPASNGGDPKKLQPSVHKPWAAPFRPGRDSGRAAWSGGSSSAG